MDLPGSRLEEGTSGRVNARASSSLEEDLDGELPRSERLALVRQWIQERRIADGEGNLPLYAGRGCGDDGFATDGSLTSLEGGIRAFDADGTVTGRIATKSIALSLSRTR